MDRQTDRPTEQTRATEGSNETNARTDEPTVGGQGSVTTDSIGQGTNTHLERLRAYYNDYTTADSPPMDWSQDEDTWQWGDAEEEETEGGEEREAGNLSLLIIVLVVVIVIAGNR